MIECGMGDYTLWQKFYARYFLPLDQYVDKPNPYNKGTEFENTPWRLTYFDQMEGGYEETLKSYFRVPLSTFTQRIYYNKPMVAEVWDPAVKGSEFPTDYSQFIDLCKALVAAHPGRGFVPISGGTYSFERIDQTYQIAFTANYLDRLDTNYDGTVSQMESSGPLYAGTVKMTEPPIQADFEVTHEFADYSPPGATSIQRDEADFLFLQKHAAMLPTGSWDYSSLDKRKEFELGVADTPIPTKDNPKYGKYVAGPPSEADTRGAFPFAVTKVSPNASAAVDFLQFAASRKMNEELNRQMFWLPVILGAKPRKELEPFAPHVEGYSVGLLYVGPNTQIDFTQLLPLYLIGKKTYQEFVDAYMDAFRRKTPEGAQDYVRNLNQTLDQQMRSAAVRRAAMNGAPGAAAMITGQPADEYKRIVEAYVTQITARDHEVRVWVDNAKLYDQQQEQQK
jgi:raffinose/stachyose/melibiose transport system substrate-binding protein